MAVPERKTCAECGAKKEAAEFYIVRDGHGWVGSSSACRPCMALRARRSREARRDEFNGYARAYAAANAEKINARRRRRGGENRERERDYHRKKKYGLGPGDYAELLEAQGGVCAICGLPESALWKGQVRSLAVDHCHITGAVRGLLCFSCNVGLGKFRDDPALLSAAADYLSADR